MFLTENVHGTSFYIFKKIEKKKFFSRQNFGDPATPLVLGENELWIFFGMEAEVLDGIPLKKSIFTLRIVVGNFFSKMAGIAGNFPTVKKPQILFLEFVCPLDVGLSWKYELCISYRCWDIRILIFGKIGPDKPGWETNFPKVKMSFLKFFL